MNWPYTKEDCDPPHKVYYCYYYYYYYYYYVIRIRVGKRSSLLRIWIGCTYTQWWQMCSACCPLLVFFYFNKADHFSHRLVRPWCINLNSLDTLKCTRLNANFIDFARLILSILCKEQIEPLILFTGFFRTNGLSCILLAQTVGFISELFVKILLNACSVIKSPSPT